MRRSITLTLLVVCLASLSCRLLSNGQGTGAPAAENTLFTGQALIDSNHNRKPDAGDQPLQNAIFLVGGYAGYTDANGSVQVALPGLWDEPVTAQMLPPAGSDYTLIGPDEVTLQAEGLTRAEFLFATPEGGSATGKQPGPKPGSIETDLTYCTAPDGTPLKMDVYYPKQMSAPAPAIVYIHGGGWVRGDKKEGAGMLFFPALQKAGYIMVAVNYRLAPDYKFPAPIEDVKCAIRHLRANSTRYNLDPGRIGALGGSAGGHIAALLGLADASAGWDVGAYPEQSSRVGAVVDLFGPSDLVQLFKDDPKPSASWSILGAKGARDPLLSVFSPVTYITPDDPPFLLLHGNEDTEVPPEQSQILYDQLQAAGVPAELVWVKNAGHSFQPTGGKLDPSLAELSKIVTAFFERYLP
ncbi:MAG: alpha/beta hydrolase [Chloroflexota bacterium]